MKKFTTLLCALTLACFCLVAPAAAVTVLPDSIALAPGDISPAFGTATTIFTDQYDDFGLMFGPGKVAVFNDYPLAWGGVNASNIVDLLSPVEGFFVMPNTTTKALTSFVEVEIGYADEGSLLLEVFDIHGVLLGSAVNGLPLGPHSRTTAGVIAAGIHSFKVSGLDTWGMDQISFSGDLSPVPIPGTLMLIASGLVGLAGLRLRRQ